MAKIKLACQKAWCIKRGTYLLPFSIRQTRVEAIESITMAYNAPWKELKKNGLKAIKVEIVEVLKEARSSTFKDPTQPFPQLKLFQQ